MTLGQKIAKARRSRGYTQQDLADKVGVGRLHITKLESDREAPSLYCLKEIADELGMRKIQEALCDILGED